MRAEAHISIARADVRGGQLTRHTARRFGSGRVYAISTALGMPRTWHGSTTAVLDGLEQALNSGVSGSSAEALERLVQHARNALADWCDCLVERTVPDATLIALMLANDQLHIMSVGPGRVYLQRGGRPQRLTSRKECSGGLLRARPSVCSTPVQPGDLILAGSVTAFSMTSIAKAMSVLSADPNTAPPVLATLLTEPAAKAGVGAAAVALRIL